jgi:hypothetical protein
MAATIAEVNALVARIDAKTIELQNSINKNIGKLPGFLADKVVAGWNKFCEYMRKVWDFWKYVVENMGDPDKLNETAQAWSSNVGGPVSGKAGVSTLDSAQVDNYWDGTSAQKYKDLLPAQNLALKDINNITDGIGKALKDTAAGIWKFWAGLLVALGALVVGIIGAIASSATVFGLPAAPFIAGGAALAADIAVGTGMMLLRGDCKGANTDLNQWLNEKQHYKDDHWPKIVTT